MPVVALTPAQIAAGLRSPYRLSNAQFTFSIPTAQSFWETTPGNYTGANDQPTNNYSVLNAGEATAFRAAIAAWDQLIANNFTEVADNATAHGEIRVAFTSSNMDAQTAGYAYQGSNQVPTSIVGDIWLNSSTVGQSFDPLTDNYITFLHEIGHTLGLKHPFEGTPIPAPYDEQRYTLMSYTTATPAFTRYFTATQGGGITATSSRVIVATPGVLDIAAVQGIYGADLTTAAGNDTYSFTASDTRIRTVYDGGGTDTWDLSTVARNNIVDLRPGAYSSIGYWTIAEQTAYWQAQFPGFNSFIATQMTAQPWYEWKDNVGIAFSTVIENVVGGTQNDTITGNDANNLIDLSRGGNDMVAAGAGDDGIYFGAAFTGADVVDGGAGTLDQVALQGNYAGAAFASGSLTGIEQVVLLSGAEARFGDTANNRYSYNLTTVDANVAAGQVLTFTANALLASEAFTLNASAETNGQILTYGGAGADTITGGQQNDGFFFGNARWGAGDRVDGQGGGLDQLGIQGNYTGANGIVFGANQLVSIELLVLLSASELRFGGGGTTYSYDITLTDNNMAPLAISANRLTATEVLHLNATPLTGPAITVYSGAANDAFSLGGGADTIYGGGGADQMAGGGGNDVFAYRAVGDSAYSTFDTIIDFSTGDRINLAQVDANAVLGGSQQFTFIGAAGLTAAGQLQVTGIGAGQYQVAGEVDGVAGADFRIVVNSDHALSLTDFTGVTAPSQTAPVGEAADVPETVRITDSHHDVPAAPADVVMMPDRAPITEPLTASLLSGSAPAALADAAVGAFAFAAHGSDIPADHDAILYAAMVQPTLDPAIAVA